MLRSFLKPRTYLPVIGAIAASLCLVGCPKGDGHDLNQGMDTRAVVYFDFTPKIGVGENVSPGGYGFPGMLYVTSDGSQRIVSQWYRRSTETWCFARSIPDSSIVDTLRSAYSGDINGNYWIVATNSEQDTLRANNKWNPSWFPGDGRWVISHGGDNTADENGCTVGNSGNSVIRSSFLGFTAGNSSRLTIDNRSTLSIINGTSAPVNSGVSFISSKSTSSSTFDFVVLETSLAMAETVSNSEGSVHAAKFQQIGSFGFSSSRDTGIVAVDAGDAIFNLSGTTSASGTDYPTSGGYTIDVAASSGTFNAATGAIDLTLILNPITPKDVLPSFEFHFVSIASNRAPIADAGSDQTVECNPSTKTGSVPLSSIASIPGSSPITKAFWGKNGVLLRTGTTTNTADLAFGTHTVSLDVYAEDGLSSSDTMSVNVIDTTPPTITLDSASQRIDACSVSPISVPTPTAVDCTDTTVTGTIVERDGVTVSEAFSGSIPAYPGKTVIRWTATDTGGLSSTKDQTIEVSPSLIGKTHVGIRDRVVIMNHGSTFGPTLGAVVDVGTDAITGNIYSPGLISLGDRDVVNGSTFSPIPVSKGNDVRITNGMVVATQTIPAFPLVSVVPGTSDIRVEKPVTVMNLPVGSYRAVTVNGGTTLALSPGNYAFESLTMESGSYISVTPGTIPTVVQVNSNATIRGLTPTDFDPALLRLEVAGTSDVYIEPNFTGNVLAPNAKVTVGVGNGSQFTGSIRASDIELRPGVQFRCLEN